MAVAGESRRRQTGAERSRLPRPARALVQRVLEVRIAAADLLDTLEGRWRERRPSEVGVDDDAGRIERAPELRGPARLHLGADACAQVAGIGAGTDLLTGALEHRPGSRHRERVPDLAGELVDGGKIVELHAYVAAASASSIT